MKTVFNVLLIASASALVLISGCSDGPVYQSPEVVPPEIRAAVNHALLPELNRHRLVGVAAGVIKDGRKSVFGYGGTRVFGGAAVSNATEFEIGSITKTFTCLVLAQMVLDGTLSLDQPAQGLLPGVRFPEFEGTPITLRHLASHTAGLPSTPPDLDLSRITSLDPFENYSEARLHAWVSNYALTVEPGTRYEYSNAGMALLGQLLAAQAGLSYEALIAQRITGPLAMPRTQIALSPENAADFAQGYFLLFSVAGLSLHVPIPHWELPGFQPAGALRSDVDGMLTYLDAAMGNDSPLHDAFALETQQFVEVNSALSAGLAWHAIIAADGGEPIIWHNGATGGFTSFAGFLRDAQIGVVVLANTLPGLTGGGVDTQAIQILETLSGRRILARPAR